MARTSVRHALILIGSLALGLAGVREATPLTAAILLQGTYSILVLASFGAVLQWPRHRSWAGFATFGWSYFLPVFVFASPEIIKQTPASQFLDLYVAHSLPRPVPPQGLQILVKDDERPAIAFSSNGAQSLSATKSFREKINTYNQHLDDSIRVGHCAFTLFAAYVGSVIAQVFRNSH